MKDNLLKYFIIFIMLVIVAFLTYTLIPKKQDEVIFTSELKNLELKVGSTTQINYTISNPEISINWKSYNPNIATVNNQGIITGNEIGTTIITGTINISGNEKTISCEVNVLAANYDIALENFELPNGEILIMVNDTYSIPITYTPNNAYIENIDYNVENNSIISVENNQIVALKSGYTNLSITINNKITKKIKVNVTNNRISPTIIKPIENVTLEQNEYILAPKENKKINYTYEPNDGYIFDTLWESLDKNIADVDENGNITALKTGTTYINLTINNIVKKTIKVIVKNQIEKIDFDYIPKKVLKVGESFTLYPTITPSSAPKTSITYISSNPKVLSVNNNGKATANSSGNATITIKSIDGNVSKSLSFTVLNKTGVINSTQYIWGFSKETDLVPKRADTSFFTKLATNGIGVVNGNNYIYQKYNYDIKNSTLTINGKNKILMRFYYPNNTDLGNRNIFTFIGGVGETNFGGLAKSINDNPSIIKSSAITIIIPEGSNIKIAAQNVVEATNFVKAIIKQKSHARNIIGGYSNGGPVAGDAANIGSYDKLMLINTSFYWVSSKTKLANTEIVVYSANNDSWRGTDSFISEMYSNGFKNVTIVSNNPKMSSNFGSKYLVINPGNAMENGHTSNNLIKSNYFAYAGD